MKFGNTGIFTFLFFEDIVDDFDIDLGIDGKRFFDLCDAQDLAPLITPLPRTLDYKVFPESLCFKMVNDVCLMYFGI